MIVASIISPKLCGGILVAYPAEIPLVPFTSKLGNLAGNTVGSRNLSSKFGAHETVDLSSQALNIGPYKKLGNSAYYFRWFEEI